MYGQLKFGGDLMCCSREIQVPVEAALIGNKLHCPKKILKDDNSFTVEID